MEKSGEYERGEIVKSSIFKPSELLEKIPKLEGVKSGIEGLDDLFFTIEEREGELVKVSLGGIPKFSVFNLTGVSDTGKSLMVEQFSIKRASEGERVAFITVESPAPFVVASLKYRALAMGLEFEKFEDNIILIDAASNSSVRENIPSLLSTLAYVIKEFKIKYTIIDSVTGLFENKEMMARSIVRRLFNFMKKWYQTAIFVSQKRSGHEELSAEAAGGYAVGHIVDGTMITAKELISSAYAAKIYKANIGEVVRLFRIDGCRMSGHDTKTHFMEITDTGLVKISDPISKN